MLTLISMEEALGEIQAVASERLVDRLTVPLAKAVGHVLAEPAVAALSIPPFRNSARDGFVLSADAMNQSGWLPLVGEIRAGDDLTHAESLQ